MPRPRRSAAFRALRAAATAALLLAAPARAEEPVVGDVDTPDQLLDRGHEAVAEGLDDAAQWFDRQFGEPLAEPSGAAGAQLDLTLETFRSGVPDDSRTRLRVRGGVDLPQFERRVRLLIDSDADAALTGRDLSGVRPQTVQRARAAGGVGLGLTFFEAPGQRATVAAGLAGGLSPEVFVTARYRVAHAFGETFVAGASPTLYWRSERGAGLGLAATLDWRSGEDHRWRAGLFTGYEERDGAVDWSGELGWRRRLDADAAIGAQVGLSGEADAGDGFRELWASLRLRRRTGRPWLFVELEPGLSWHEKADFRLEPTIALRIEAQFDTGPPREID